MIRVGSGKKVNRAGEFMSYDTGSSPNINYLAIATGWGANGVWQFKNGKDRKSLRNTSLHCIELFFSRCKN